MILIKVYWALGNVLDYVAIALLKMRHNQSLILENLLVLPSSTQAGLDASCAFQARAL